MRRLFVLLVAMAAVLALSLTAVAAHDGPAGDCAEQVVGEGATAGNPVAVVGWLVDCSPGG